VTPRPRGTTWYAWGREDVVEEAVEASLRLLGAVVTRCSRALHARAAARIAALLEQLLGPEASRLFLERADREFAAVCTT